MVRGGLIVLNKNGMPESVIGSKKSYSTLKAMTKDELIELLGIAQHNYECVNESLFNITQHAEKLDKALDKALTIIIDLNECTNIHADKYITCPFREECEKGNKCISNYENWRDYFMGGDK